MTLKEFKELLNTLPPEVTPKKKVVIYDNLKDETRVLQSVYFDPYDDQVVIL